MIFSVITLFVPPDRKAETLELLRTVQGHIELCSDFVGSWIREREHPSFHVVYAEQWKTEQSMFEHVRSPLYRHVLGAMELSTKPPEVVFYFLSQTRGMDLIQDLRKSRSHSITHASEGSEQAKS